jgi:DHA3 family tetracycline resistance protein-like MFS transporter
MHHSYEALDRPGGFSRIALLAPLRHRDFRLLWAGMSASLVGDGIFVVAMAWEVYSLSGSPSALGLIGAAMTVPTIGSLVLGGVASDRVDRRRLIVMSDAVRGAAVALVAALALAGQLRLWELGVLVAVYGAGTGFFAPAFDALVPELLPQGELAQANSLDQCIRPIALRFLGPALGGLLISSVGSGAAFALDAGSFGFCARAVLGMRSRPPARRQLSPSPLRDLKMGFSYVRRHVWLWGTFIAAALAYLLFMGPTEVLLPFIVKNTLRGSAADFGAVLAAGGLASVACALAMGQSGLPRREIAFIYVVWTAATFALAGYGLATAVWQLMIVSATFNGLESAGTIVWATLKQRNVPPGLLGRVSSLDWLISIGLLPVSLALTGPVAGALGARTTLMAAGILGGIVTLAALALPGMRDVETARAKLPPAALEATAGS